MRADETTLHQELIMVSLNFQDDVQLIRGFQIADRRNLPKPGNGDGKR